MKWYNCFIAYYVRAAP